MFNLRLTPAIFLALFAACGGGGGGSAPTPKPSSITAIDGYLSGSVALCDANNNGIANSDEVTVSTDGSGVATFPAGCSFPVVVTGGKNTDTQLDFIGQLKSPANATVATPLTTLIASGMSEAQVRTALGLGDTVSILTTDPLKKNAAGGADNQELLKKTLAVQQMMQKTSEAVGSAGGTTLTDAANQALYAEVANSFAKALMDGGTVKTLMTSGDSGTCDNTILTSLVKAAVVQVKASTNTALAAVKVATVNLDADSVAQVAATSIQVQSDALLKLDYSTSSKLSASTELVKTNQSDKTLANKVKENKAILEKPPSDDTKNLSTSIKNDVAKVITDGGGAVAAPNNYLALVGDAISLDAGSALTMTAFQSSDGISVAWPLPYTSTMKLTLGSVGTYAMPEDLKVTAAISIEEIAPGKGKVMAYVDKVALTKTSTGDLSITIADAPNAQVYMLSTDQKKFKLLNVASDVKNIVNTLGVSSGLTGSSLKKWSIQIGDVASFATTQAGTDFSGITSLTGKFKVSVVVTDMPLRKANGDELPSLTISVPTELYSDGTVKNSKVVAGKGLTGFITFTNK
jgi:hypothetical protein